MFTITQKPIDIAQLKEQACNDKAGALVIFEGWVRNHNEGKQVSSLEYEAYSDLANKEAAKIIEEAKAQFDILEVTGQHREGHLAIGDCAVWIGVSSAHRGDAFKACQFLIDEIKLRLPIWKKEHYVDEEAKWVNCQGCYHHAHIHYHEEDYYDKQLKLEGMGEAGQQKLKDARVLVVGAGGLGCPALQYLAAAGVGEITICDGDRLEISNLHRQILFDYNDIGEHKATLARKSLMGLNPFIKISAITKRVNLRNVRELVGEHDMVLDCTDNFIAKYMIHDACFLEKTPLVQASIYMSEGQLQTFAFDQTTSCMRCIWPEIPAAGCVGNCADVGVIGVVPGVLGTMQAADAIKYLLGWPSRSTEHTFLVDIPTWDISPIKRVKDPCCPLCGESPNITELAKTHYGISDLEVDLEELSDEEIQSFKFIDIRGVDERDEHQQWECYCEHRPGAPADSFHDEGRVLLVCAKGIRSKNLATAARDAGAGDVYSLCHGMKSVQENWERIQALPCPSLA